MSQTSICLDYIPPDSDFSDTRFIAGRERLHSAVTFEFRPMDILGRAMLMEVRSRSGNEVKFLEVLIRELSKRLVSWSLTMPSNAANPQAGQVPMPIDEKHLRRLRPVLLNRMFDIVIWQADPGDIPPEGIETSGDTDEFESRVQAMLSQSAAS